MRWNLQPFAIATPALILGILSDSILNTSSFAIFYGVLFFIIILSLSAIILKLHQNNITLSLSIILGFLMLGYLASQRFWLANKPSIGHPELESVSVFTAVVISKPDRTTNSVRYKIRVENIKIENSWRALDEEAILYAGNENFFKYGDMLMINSKPYFLERQKNPHAFDYTFYLQRKGIFFQAYSDAKNTALIKHDQLRDFKYWTLRIGDTFERLLARFIHGDRELNMARAMILGRRNEITPEMEYVYESTGTSHILAVSGLHVGIIFLIISRVFRSIRNRKGLKWVYFSLAISAIWAFAIITGLSPSVKRAALMFTFILIAEWLNRNHNIYNTILASAFCILLLTPTLLYSVSFQFSYMAVLGIVFLYKNIYRLIFIENRFLDFFWQITALSFSVQIATFAINIHYFNHFPALFPITNLFAIPTAMAVVMGSLMIFITSFLPVVPQVLGFVLQSCIWVYNEIMIALSRLDITSIEGLTLKAPYVVLLILLAFTLMLFLDFRRLYIFRLFVVMLVITGMLVFKERYQYSRQQKLVIYAVGDRFYLDLFKGNVCYSNIINNSSDQSQIYYNVLPNRNYHQISGLRNIEELNTYSAIGKNQLLVIGGKSVLAIKDFYSLDLSSDNIEVDYLVLDQNSVKFIDHIEKNLIFRNVILDGNLNHWEIEKVTKRLSSNKKVHSIDRDGAFILTI